MSSSDTTPGPEKEQRAMDWSKILGPVIGAFIGAILGIAGTFYLQGREIENLKAQVENLRSQLGNADFNQPKDQQTESKVKPDRLIEIIKEQQRIRVRESCGEFAYQSFTLRNLDEFKQTDVPKQVTDKLRRNGEFLEVVLAIKQMTLGEQQRLLEQASRTYKQTWAELGKISCEGQTDKGQEAERMIAGAIVGLVREISKLSPEAIKKMSND